MCHWRKIQPIYAFFQLFNSSLQDARQSVGKKSKATPCIWRVKWQPCQPLQVKISIFKVW